MNNSRVAIGLPVYNGANYISKALDSIRAQTFTNFCIIIGDNASTDATEEICREYLKKDNRIIYYRHSENLGAAPNHNFVFKQIDSTYFKWAAHDDMLEPDYLRQCVQLLEEDPTLAIAHSPAYEIDPQDNKTGTYDYDIRLDGKRPRDRFWRILWVRHFTEPFALMRSEFIDKTKLYGSYVGSDRNLTAEMLLQGNIAYTKERLFCRRSHPESYMASIHDNPTKLKWFDTKAKNPFLHKGIVTFQEYLSAILRLPLPMDERIACLAILTDWANRRVIDVAGGDRDVYRDKIAQIYAPANL
ncbi:MAG: glycosyltransferase family 2 protein [Xenococcaceae cyanobacterium]